MDTDDDLFEPLYDGRQRSAFTMCKRCGATVMSTIDDLGDPVALNLHRRWHEDLDTGFIGDNG